MTALAARARGLVTTVVSGDALAAIERAHEATALAAALARAGLASPVWTGDASAIDQVVRDRAASDFAILSRHGEAGDPARSAIAGTAPAAAPLWPVWLDEDRRSLRAIVRGLAAGIGPERRLSGTVPTPSLPAGALAELARSTRVVELAARLARRRHPLAAALAATAAPAAQPGAPIDLLAIELALAQRFAALARSRDRALAIHVAQVIDAENTGAALLLAARGGELAAERAPGWRVDHAFLAGGRQLDRAAFSAAAAGPIEAARDRLASALAATPLAGALFAAEPAALEDAALAWQIATQARLRRSEPLGLAPVVYLVLRRRDEARRVRRAVWRIALGAIA
jgi:vacuolar-type H+-ATPase subunit C/Vma6